MKELVKQMLAAMTGEGFNSPDEWNDAESAAITAARKWLEAEKGEAHPDEFDIGMIEVDLSAAPKPVVKESLTTEPVNQVLLSALKDGVELLDEAHGYLRLMPAFCNRLRGFDIAARAAIAAAQEGK